MAMPINVDNLTGQKIKTYIVNNLFTNMSQCVHNSIVLYNHREGRQ